MKPIEEPARPIEKLLTALMTAEMNADALKNALAMIALSIEGNKKPIIEIMLLSLAQNAPTRVADDSQCCTNTEDSFNGTENWVQLNNNEIPVPNPTIEGFYAPTNRDGTAENPFYEIDGTFDHGIYIEKS